MHQKFMKLKESLTMDKIISRGESKFEGLPNQFLVSAKKSEITIHKEIQTINEYLELPKSI